jgi:hypothetical protein
VYIGGPEIFFPKFVDFLNKSHGMNIIKCSKYIFYLLSKIAQAGLEKGMLNYLGKVRLGKFRSILFLQLLEVKTKGLP